MESQMVDGRDYVYNDFYPIEKSKTQLANKELWDQFHDLQTEMIITKSGRRMFPALNIKISDLDPSADYCLFLEMTLAHHCRFKFSSSVGWSPAGHEEAQSPHRIYMHPESPSKGAHWMNQDISFSRVKLTNTCSPPQGQMVLSSMHKYQPRILIVKASSAQALGWAPTNVFTFPETQFIAVTAYQNEKITKLKINYNPFAKGFRENGKSSSKRKQLISEHPDSPNSKKSASPSPPPQPEMNDRKDNLTCQSAAPCIPFYRYCYRPYPVYNQWWSGPLPLYYHQYPFGLPEYEYSIYQEVKKPRKITDFSISAIMKDCK
ncbi:T-box transcription factor TBX3-like isoform X2 [Tribolium madens]|uniref:T-box transcription factor TBX3-like isoform X2 n=1 Tax=Tribolium madens TaxID=41895 RepID=UPI001CF73778|nr:T-box transcription factor TBX3-like isoform X2 [Tribolium madens]